MKWSNHLRLLAISVLTGFLLSGAPSVQAATFLDHGDSLFQKLKQIEKERAKEREREREKEREKKQKGDDRYQKRTDVPEGNSGAFLVLAAGALGGGVLVWRRKQRTHIL
jgi:hypothetical protein